MIPIAALVGIKKPIESLWAVSLAFGVSKKESILMPLLKSDLQK
jgi:hypothetical protein